MEADLLIETKVLKQRVRDHLDPTRDLGHSDRHGKQGKAKADAAPADASVDTTETSQVARSETTAPTRADEGGEVKRNPDGTICEDCR